MYQQNYEEEGEKKSGPHLEGVLRLKFRDVFNAGIGSTRPKPTNQRGEAGKNQKGRHQRHHQRVVEQADQDNPPEITDSRGNKDAA